MSESKASAADISDGSGDAVGSASALLSVAAAETVFSRLAAADMHFPVRRNLIWHTRLRIQWCDHSMDSCFHPVLPLPEDQRSAFSAAETSFPIPLWKTESSADKQQAHGGGAAGCVKAPFGYDHQSPDPLSRSLFCHTPPTASADHPAPVHLHHSSCGYYLAQNAAPAAENRRIKTQCIRCDNGTAPVV